MTGLQIYEASRPSGKWRRQAHVAIREVLHRVAVGTTAKDVLRAVDGAYPFGERKHYPYKAWLAERSALISALGLAPDLELPNAKDIMACEVAHDLIEEGRAGEARALLDDQAPRRLNRACSACGAKVGVECLEIGDVVVTHELKDADGEAMERREAVTRIVPHEVRLHVDSGPLFGAAW